MAQLGVDYRVTYEEKNRASGRTNIYAKIVKPDGSIIGNFPLTELSGSFFAGFYEFTLVTQLDDAPGNWTVFVYSPTENHCDSRTIEFSNALTTNKFLGLK